MGDKSFLNFGAKFHSLFIQKYHEWYLCRYYLFILRPAKRFVIFICRYFKLSWDITALSQSNCRNFSCSGMSIGSSMICSDVCHKYHEWYFEIVICNWDNLEISRVAFMPNITYKSCYYLVILLPAKRL